ncbi:matrix metalloproteinase-2-like isoform X2 [Rhynchophorus ferrugineus]|uniref:matrix metalloproteinase-2-like isoform X2 n=1 Tax=Rhynchophorus ferrugineus TaxID=354439 RepID=UPI003FCE1BFC
MYMLIPHDISHKQQKYLTNFGYMPRATDDTVGALRTETFMRESLKQMQEFAGIPATGRLDSATVKLMKTPRCGLPDKILQTSGRRKRFTAKSVKWHRTDLTWSLRTPQEVIPKLDVYEVRWNIMKALQVWSKHSRLNFAEVDSDKADILIYFHRRDHGDNFPFDGPGSILAHAFFPTGQEGSSVDVHFDADENWSLKEKDSTGTNLFNVAAHEIGHSLGLSHSNVTGALMFPWYTEMTGGFEYELPEDDRLGIQWLYGPKQTNPKMERIPFYPKYTRPTTTSTTTTTTTTRPTTRPYRKPVFRTEYPRRTQKPMNPRHKYPFPNNSNPRYDRKYVYAAPPKHHGKDQPVVTKKPVKPPYKPHTSDSKESAETSPGHTPKEYPGKPLPDTCDTSYDAVAVIRRETFIFKDRYFWRIGDKGLIENNYPADLTRLWRGFPSNITHVDAVYERPDGNICFFVDDKYYLFSGVTLIPGYPKSITELGLPDTLRKIDGAMVWGHNGQTYFYSGDMYWRFDENVQKVELDYPRNMAMWKGVGTDIDAVFQWRDGKTYFFKGKGFWKFNDVAMTVEHAEQKLSASFWMGCKQDYGIKEKLNCVDDINKSSHMSVPLSSITLIAIIELIWMF